MALAERSSPMSRSIPPSAPIPRTFYRVHMRLTGGVSRAQLALEPLNLLRAAGQPRLRVGQLRLQMKTSVQAKRSGEQRGTVCGAQGESQSQLCIGQLRLQVEGVDAWGMKGRLAARSCAMIYQPKFLNKRTSIDAMRCRSEASSSDSSW